MKTFTKWLWLAFSLIVFSYPLGYAVYYFTDAGFHTINFTDAALMAFIILWCRKQDEI